MVADRETEGMTEKIKAFAGDRPLRRYGVLAVIVLAALLCEFIAFQYGALKIIRYLFLVGALFLIAWKDWKEKVILNRHLKILIASRLFLLVCEWLVYPEYGFTILLSTLMGFVIGGAVFGICYLISRGGMGAGDVKLISVLGLYLGGSVIMPAMILIVGSSAVFNIFNLIRKKTDLKSEVPFGPFVLLGSILAMALGF